MSPTQDNTFYFETVDFIYYLDLLTLYVDVFITFFTSITFRIYFMFYSIIEDNIKHVKGPYK